jgi:hypothetical protein
MIAVHRAEENGPLRGERFPELPIPAEALYRDESTKIAPCTLPQRYTLGRLHPLPKVEDGKRASLDHLPLTPQMKMADDTRADQPPFSLAFSRNY